MKSRICNAVLKGLARVVTAVLLLVAFVIPQACATDLLVSSEGTNQVLRYNGSTGAFMDAFVTAGSGGLVSPHGLVLGPTATST